MYLAVTYWNVRMNIESVTKTHRADGAIIDTITRFRLSDVVGETKVAGAT